MFSKKTPHFFIWKMLPPFSPQSSSHLAVTSKGRSFDLSLWSPFSNLTKKRSRCLICIPGTFCSLGWKLQKHEATCVYSHRHEKKKNLYSTTIIRAPPTVGLKENVTWNTETYENYKNRGVVPFLLSLILELLLLQKRACLNCNTNISLNARHAASVFCKWQCICSPCLFVNYWTKRLKIWKMEKFRICKERTGRQRESHPKLEKEVWNVRWRVYLS